MNQTDDYRRCAALIRAADGLLIAAGAGMGVDSGLPDFRGGQGFWRAYPALARVGMDFAGIADPDSFRHQPALAWGFYGHRLKLYRHTVPHDGFRLLQDIATRLEHGAFVFTSNVDGHFQKAGFTADRIHECHGSIHYLQCLDGCMNEYWPAEEFEPDIDEERCEITSALPRCPYCEGIARPNVLLFGDWGWISDRSDAQYARLKQWLAKAERPVVIEIGAGTSIPTVRLFGERLHRPLIRINTTEPQVPGRNDIGLAAGGLTGLRGIHAALLKDGFLPSSP